LDVPGEFECELRRPPQKFSDLPDDLPDALLIDLDLSAVPEDGGEPVSYYGSTLASEMRMRHPSCPIILTTRPQFLVDERRMQFLEKNVGVDLIILKDSINRDPASQRMKIQALVEGFKALSTIDDQEWQKVLDIMGASEDEGNILREAGPPVVQGQWDVKGVAGWIRNIVMGYPGILYDDLTAATRLGISLEAFRTSEVQELVSQAKYTGVFSNYKERWWRDRLFNIAQRLMQKHEIRDAVSQGFGEAFEIETGTTLSPALCVFDGTKHADWVCYILNKPVKQKNSLPYYPDNRPTVMDQARVSFKAILESDDFDETLIDADGYALVEKLWR